jgi:hypothetical protein
VGGLEIPTSFALLVAKLTGSVQAAEQIKTQIGGSCSAADLGRSADQLRKIVG